MEASTSKVSKGKKPRLSGANGTLNDALFTLIADRESMPDLKNHTKGLVQDLLLHAVELGKVEDKKLAVIEAEKAKELEIKAKHLEVIAAETAKMKLELELMKARQGYFTGAIDPDTNMNTGG